MKAIANTVALLAAAAAPAWGAAGEATGENGLLVFAFLGFGALIVVFQAVPGIIMLFSMLKGIFAAGKETEEAGR